MSSNNFGLTDYLLGRAEVDEIIKTTKIDNLSFIPSGQLPGDSVGILNSQRMTDLIAKVKSQYDLVFFDSPPILGVSDGSVLASEVDITIMVVQHRRFPRAMLQRVKQAVLNVGGRLIGVVLNNVDSKHDDGYSYYNSYNEYYGARRETPKIEPPAPQLARPRPGVARRLLTLPPCAASSSSLVLLALLAPQLFGPQTRSPPCGPGDIFDMRLSGHAGGVRPGHRRSSTPSARTGR